MQPKLGAVLFDLDGTLIDTAPSFLRVIHTLQSERSLTLSHDAQLRPVVSEGARAMLNATFPKDLCDDTLLQIFLDDYAQAPAAGAVLFDGITPLLQTLAQQQIPWGIVTNKPARFTHRLLEQMGLSTDCACTICPDDVKNTKPDPESLLLAASRLDTDPTQCVYIGDHARDIEAGRRASMFTIAALYGYIKEQDNPKHWNADHYVDTADQILPALADRFQLDSR